MSISAYPPKRPQQWSPEERYRFLSTILESFAGPLDLEEALRRIANVTLEQFAADRVMMVHPIIDGPATAVVRYALNAPRITAPLGPNSAVTTTTTISQRPHESP